MAPRELVFRRGSMYVFFYFYIYTVNTLQQPACGKKKRFQREQRQAMQFRSNFKIKSWKDAFQGPWMTPEGQSLTGFTCHRDCRKYTSLGLKIGNKNSVHYHTKLLWSLLGNVFMHFCMCGLNSITSCTLLVSYQLEIMTNMSHWLRDTVW